MTALEQKIVPHLWFDKEAGEAARFYTAIFPNSRISGAVTIHDTPSGSTEIVSFVLCGQEFQAISAGPHFTLNPSISFTVNCATVEEVDALWAQLSEGGLALMPLDAYPFSPRFGWMQDRFGVSWQVTAAEGQEGQAPVLVPSLLFTGKNYGKAEEAVHFYTSIFEDAQVGQIIHNPPEADGKTTVMYADFQLRAWIQLQRGALLHRQVRRSGRSGLLLGEAQRKWRRGRHVRLAQRQIWPLVADRTCRHG